MTSQLLESNRLSGFDAASSTAQPLVDTVKKLPYQANHQVELMHLQAEIDALLQHLQTVKQQRLVMVGSQSHH